MSEKQIDALREILKRSDTAKNSVELDAEIMLAAKIENELREQHRPLLTYLLSPLGAVGKVIASVAITSLVFLSMAKLVSAPEPEAIFADSRYHNNSYGTSSSKVFGTRPDEPNRPLTRPYTIEYSADEVLLELSLPSVTELIKSMEFVAENQRSEATIELISALADIRAMIGVGQLDDARDRYFELRDRCYACQLPRTLEALALNNIRDHGSG